MLELGVCLRSEQQSNAKCQYLGIPGSHWTGGFRFHFLIYAVQSSSVLHLTPDFSFNLSHHLLTGFCFFLLRVERHKILSKIWLRDTVFYWLKRQSTCRTQTRSFIAFFFFMSCISFCCSFRGLFFFFFANITFHGGIIG